MWSDISCEDWPYEDWVEALESTAEGLLWEAGVEEPPVDAFLVATRLGLLVTEDYALPARAEFVRLAGGGATFGGPSQPTIVLGAEDRLERRQFAVAHELGEFAAARVFDRLGADPREMQLGTREQIANGLAGRLLLPKAWFTRWGSWCDWDLLELKTTFATASHELIARRMLEASPKVVVTLFDHGNLVWRQTSFHRPAGPILSVEHDRWHQCHTLGLPTAGQWRDPTGSEVTLSCWPIHEPNWKREIMRMELADWE